MTLPLPALIFGALAAVFLLLALFDFRRHGSTAPPARKTWLRIGVIFALVAFATFVFRPK